MALEEEADLSDIETTEFDWLVVDSAMDVISGMAVALGPSFAELWKIFEKQVLRYASSGESLERASACGVLAETITGMGEGVTPFTGSMMQVLLKRLGDEDAQTKSNAAYAVGRLVEKSNDDATVTKAYPQILTRLDPLFSITEGRCRDNAAGCISRLILKHRNNVPVAEVLPALVRSGVLPLKEDYEENEPVWKMIVQLCKFSLVIVPYARCANFGSQTNGKTRPSRSLRRSWRLLWSRRLVSRKISSTMRRGRSCSSWWII